MPKRLTVFYSWQSDTPSNLNRNFIEKALHEALKRLHSDATLEPAFRDATVELDKDTKGVAGSPPIADTILRKIEDCAVFVADLTFVGESMRELTDSSGKPRFFPNPNVLIEHGFALKCHGHAALVGIMNTAYGEPNAETLPFDLRHLRWPITYHLTDSSDPGKATQFEKLAETLVDALRLILVKDRSPTGTVEEFIPQKPTKNAAVFFDETTDLVPEGPFGEKAESFTVPDEGRGYLRLYPTFAVTPFATELDAEDLARTGGLRPMGRVSGWNVVRNAWGAIIYEPPQNGKLYHYTQLFLSGEIWGLDARCLNATRLRELSRGQFSGFVASSAVEEIFAAALQSYLTFAQTFLKLPLPLQIEAGLTGIKGYPIAVENTVRGKALHDLVQWDGEVGSYETPAHEILAPFFKLVWAKCGIQRPPSRQAALAQQFGSAG